MDIVKYRPGGRNGRNSYLGLLEILFKRFCSSSEVSRRHPPLQPPPKAQRWPSRNAEIWGRNREGQRATKADQSFLERLNHSFKLVPVSIAEGQSSGILYCSSNSVMTSIIWAIESLQNSMSVSLNEEEWMVQISSAQDSLSLTYWK